MRESWQEVDARAMVATKQTGEEKVHQRGGGGQSNVSRVQRGKLAWTMPEMSPHPKCTTRLSLSMPDAKAVKTNRGRTTWRTPTLNPRHVRWRRTGDCTGLLLQLRFLTVTVVCCVASTTTIALFASRTTAPSTVVKRPASLVSHSVRLQEEAATVTAEESVMRW